MARLSVEVQFEEPCLDLEESLLACQVDKVTREVS